MFDTIAAIGDFCIAAFIVFVIIVVGIWVARLTLIVDTLTGRVAPKEDLDA